MNVHSSPDALSCSPYGERFVLKGAWLFYRWDIARRSTRDVDFLGYGENSPAAVAEVFREVSQTEVTPDDGLSFDGNRIRSSELQEGEEYTGVRAKITARLGSARILTRVDVGFGAALAEDPIPVDVPVMLGYPSPRLRAYSPEAAIAEKLEAMIRFGARNDRLKDYFDLYTLSRERRFEVDSLREQISVTFARRETALPDRLPTGLSDGFGSGEDQQVKWRAFLDSSGGVGVPRDFSDVVRALREFAYPPLRAAATGEVVETQWTPEAGWK